MASGCALGEAAAEAKIPAASPAAGMTRTPPENASKGGRKCDLCSKLGMGGDTHSREWCYVDPKSKAYKPEVR